MAACIYIKTKTKQNVEVISLKFWSNVRSQIIKLILIENNVQ